MGRPYTCILDVTERCNLKCVMCYFSSVDRIRFPPFSREAAPNGFMPLDLFKRIAGDFFPMAAHVALACAAEPLLHPEFQEILSVASRYEIPDLWFPTNLLPLTEGTAEAVIDAGVRTVAVSIDGVTAQTYEKIRVGARFERILSRLELLNDVKKRRGVTHPRLRIIFTWMRTNRSELQDIPAFAARHGAEELDVRFVSPTVGVDVERELLSGEPAAALQDELDRAARAAMKAGLRMNDYPELAGEAYGTGLRIDDIRRQWLRFRAGTNNFERFRHDMRARKYGCPHPGFTWVFRPNGAVLPCMWWRGDLIGFYPEDSLQAVLSGRALADIRDGLAREDHTDSCGGCDQRRKGFYRPQQ